MSEAVSAVSYAKKIITPLKSQFTTLFWDRTIVKFRDYKFWLDYYVARAVAKYKPIPTGQTPTHFECVLAAIAQGNDFVCMNVNPIGKPKLAESQPEQQTKIWYGRLKYYLHAFHSRNRLLAQLSPNKGINVNNL